MAEYITRKAAIAYIREQSEEFQKAFEEFGGESGIYADAYNDLAEDFYSIPAVDVAPVVHAQWEHIGIVKKIGPIYPRCSACGIISAAYRTQWEGLQGPWKYCPNCGAKMDIEDGGDGDAAD